MITHTSFPIQSFKPRKKQNLHSRLRENLIIMAILVAISVWVVTMSQ